MALVESSIRKVLEEFEAEGCDVSGIDMPRLTVAVIDEYASGASGTVRDVVLDLQDSVGLEEFGMRCPD